MTIALLTATMLVFGVLALRARHLIASALWLAGTSALLAVLLYELGAQQVAVIELSVGAGLVTVLFLFAISIAGEDAIQAPGRLPHWLVLSLVLAGSGLLSWFLLQASPAETVSALEPSFSGMLWETRGLDVLVQIVLIFAGVLGLLGLLAETKAPLAGAMAAEYIARREQDLAVMQAQSSQPEEPVLEEIA